MLIKASDYRLKMTLISNPSLEQLQQENAHFLALIGQHENTIETLQHQLHLFRTARFGRKSEKNVVSEPLTLQFDEATLTTELTAPKEAENTQTETISYTRNKKGTGRKPLPKSLPYIETIHDLRDDEKQCACGCLLTHIDDEITEQLGMLYRK